MAVCHRSRIWDNVGRNSSGGSNRWECTLLVPSWLIVVIMLESVCVHMYVYIYIYLLIDRSIDGSTATATVDTGYGQDQVGHVRGVGHMPGMGLSGHVTRVLGWEIIRA